MLMLHRFSQARILIVDDDAFSQRVVRNALMKSGFEKITMASDGAEALEKTFVLKPDLVILDLNMPHLDGIGYCEQVRNTAELPRMPIIVQTMLEERAAKLRALSSGADDFLHKPLDLDELSLRVCGHLERYFAMRDMANMCEYLKMELQQVRTAIDRGKPATLPEPLLNVLDRHCEVLETIAGLSDVGT